MFQLRPIRLVHLAPSFVLALVITISANSQPIDDPLTKSFNEHHALSQTSTIHLQWQLTGPVVNSARVESVAAHPDKPGTLYAAFGSGGLWKSIDHGIHWHCIFENQPAPGIGDVAIANSNPDIIYLGSGESLRKRRNFTMPGNGIYRSSDGGKTWGHRGLQHVRQIGEIAVHPTNPDVVVVAAMGHFWTPDARRGLYRTANGGESWDHVLPLDEETLANDVVFAPGNPEIIYASTWSNDLDTVLFEGIHGSNSSVYRSEDGGQTWHLAAQGLPIGAQVGRIGLAVSYQDPDVVYALVDNHQRERTEASEIYRTQDGGKSWKKTHDQPLLFSSVIGWYFSDIYVNPLDDGEIYALGVRLARSSDSGQSFEFVAGTINHLYPSPAQTLHLDHCELYIDPKDPNHLVLGNDGGLYSSFDQGVHWTHHNNIPTGEYYTMTLEQSEPYRILAGAQDNATVIGHTEPWHPGQPDNWEYLWIDAWSGGDGCFSAFDPDSSHIVYMSMQNGAIQRLNIKTQSSQNIKPKTPAALAEPLTYHFVTPYFISKHSGALYHAGNHLMKSAKRDTVWQLLSPDLSQSANYEKNGLAISAVSESPLAAGVLYAANDLGAAWRSDDDGDDWTEISTGLANAYVRSIVPSRHDSNHVYLTMTGLNYDDLNAYVYSSADRGNQWTYLSSSLPAHPVNVIAEDLRYPDVLYLGTMRGVYMSTDRGRTWQVLGTGLPQTSVADLQILEDNNQLVAATHGRGIYFIDLDPLHHHLSQLSKAIHLHPIAAVQAPRRRPTHNDIDLASRDKVSIHFTTSATAPLQLVIADADEQTIYSQEIAARAGLNQYDWWMITKSTTSDQPYHEHYDKYLEPGTYQVRLEQAGSKSNIEILVVTPGH